MLDRQLDVFGGEHDIAPAHERMRLFEPVRTSVGQTAMPTESLSAPMPGNLELVNRAIAREDLRSRARIAALEGCQAQRYGDERESLRLLALSDDLLERARKL